MTHSHRKAHTRHSHIYAQKRTISKLAKVLAGSQYETDWGHLCFSRPSTLPRPSLFQKGFCGLFGVFEGWRHPSPGWATLNSEGRARTTPGYTQHTHQTGCERGSRLAQRLAAHAHEVGRFSRGWPGLSCHWVWKEVPPGEGTAQASPPQLCGKACLQALWESLA